MRQVIIRSVIFKKFASNLTFIFASLGCTYPKTYDSFFFSNVKLECRAEFNVGIYFLFEFKRNNC